MNYLGCGMKVFSEGDIPAKGFESFSKIVLVSRSPQTAMCERERDLFLTEKGTKKNLHEAKRMDKFQITVSSLEILVTENWHLINVYVCVYYVLCIYKTSV